MKIPRLIYLFVLGHMCAACSLLSGCRSDPHNGKEQVIAIAEKKVIKKGWKEFKVEGAVFKEDRWIVMIWELPAKPGGFVTVEIARSGKVSRLLPGY